ncbi:hydroxyethylthiazole kinase [Ruminiclostridium cellulolyticum]|uniref:Hydroxyethylthiazole kinase n=1 Tax=Ruminiclostridium cellulolyticum (strain ATCC 35319 / DSM 5812 / JCM 6584 / H10) TaxID=394503 RepID=THIM_RUMCH|nr:hydroxyethylthiazole kinase [Ruminiclostridium cellulolyticum]B8I3J5.1 RecName: Full=Hydroxyethylthiazole kinase; AltName: Full=4-methyl-5-beta-hydroxyethylthiazole kinase; Short=TH kinase; Short=Thz kinase [Ruminiclostridium cellulolyticum H10]ACL76338.1 hydroxyethylthiazole kinase [Ruminiclostridium cellulolyticum H10]
MSEYTKQITRLISEVRSKKPLIHNITNYVTVNDCANVTLAIGASPIMADDIDEAADITSISSALVINIGTLNKRTIESMILSGKKANEKGIPVIFDPVGAGASALRNETTSTILDKIKISVLRGNLSEISYIAGRNASTKGVDASEADIQSNDSIAVAKAAAVKLGCVVAVTGAVDVISDGKNVVTVLNGHKMLSNVTGTGCMTTALVGSFCGAVKDYFKAAVAGVTVMGISGEIAYEAAGHKGTGSYHIAIIDAISRMDENIFGEKARINEI